MRLPPYGLCEHGNPGSSPPGPREASPLVVISQPVPIAPHLSGPAEDSSSDSVSRGREEGVGPSSSGPASRAGRQPFGLSFLGGERRQAQPLSKTKQWTPPHNPIPLNSQSLLPNSFSSYPPAPFKTPFLPRSYCSPLFSVTARTILP